MLCLLYVWQQFSTLALVSHIFLKFQMVPLHFILQENAANAHCTCPGFQATAPLHLKDGFPAPSSLPPSHGRGGARPLAAAVVARGVASPAGPVCGAGPLGCRADVSGRHRGGVLVFARRRGRARTRSPPA